MDNNLEVIHITCKADSSDYNEFNKYINCFKEKVLKDSENGEILIKFFNYLLTDLDSIYITTGDSIDRKTIDLFKRYVLKELRRKKEND